MPDVIIQVDEAEPAVAMELSDELAGVDGVESIENVRDSDRSRFGIESLIIAWLIVVTG